MTRQQTQAHAHRQETWTTPGGKKRYATINANLKPDGTISRDVYAHEDGDIMNPRSKQRTTDGRTDGVKEARNDRVERMGNNQPCDMDDGITKDTPLRDLIAKVDPDRENIPSDMTVGELREQMQAGEDYYKICNVDSCIRERHFEAIAEAHNIDYDEVYKTRLSNEQP